MEPDPVEGLLKTQNKPAKLVRQPSRRSLLGISEEVPHIELLNTDRWDVVLPIGNRFIEINIVSGNPSCSELSVSDDESISLKTMATSCDPIFPGYKENTIQEIDVIIKHHHHLSSTRYHNLCFNCVTIVNLLNDWDLEIRP
uniref:Uncharacterized protein n=1 Tax=Glyptapanteles flavicoxis TaxID=463051 RepID=B7S8M1_9HYME|nr:hypothetical protein GFP_L2_0200 [Glyptapanteles flavicoxis]